MIERAVPGQRVVEALDRMIGDPVKQGAEIGLGVEAVELGGTDQGVHRSRAIAAGVRSGEEIIFSS